MRPGYGRVGPKFLAYALQHLPELNHLVGNFDSGVSRSAAVPRAMDDFIDELLTAAALAKRNPVADVYRIVEAQPRFSGSGPHHVSDRRETAST